MKRTIEQIRTNKPLYALHQDSIKAEQNIGIALLFATLWIVLIGYLASVPVSADEGNNMVSPEMQMYIENLGNGKVFELEDLD